MTSQAVRIEQQHPAGHRNRHTPHLCTDCGGPLTVDGRCTRCMEPTDAEWPMVHFPDLRARLERMERKARR